MRDKPDVWTAVEEFRAQHSKDLAGCPIDVLTAIEVRMRLDVIPFPHLFKLYSVDAAMKPDFSGIYVDKRSYDGLEGVPRWLYNRLRFSLAHELGHIVMHRDLVKGVEFKSLQDFWDWSRRYKESKYGLEWEANEFGGRLLVPVKSLKSDFDTFVSQIKSEYPEWWTNLELRRALTVQLGEKYQVHEDVISCRFDRENLWPSV